MRLGELIVCSILRDADEKWRRSQRVAALRKRKKWRKADLAKLMQLDMPSWVAPRIQELKRSGDKGRGVVAPVTNLEQEIVRKFSAAKLWLDPNTPPHRRVRFYQRTKWFPDFIEAAYRGELEMLQEEYPGARRKSSRLSLYTIAEDRVAEAARISPAKVRALCARVRRERGPYPADAATSANELRDHLENGLKL